ncbi:MAG: molybdate ABC transporter substrate-binding protein [Hyphomicrobium sp.]|uniref:molybdate ABC transporter substrate-binding protein n=1 Tax=Hyphomicrobium sp. TaxID=82 RepID=UPI001329AF42|nr:molybdate ABC transporter substrate-binding protein [Hyphomicrobium sp.]KAB2940048.1 MAG: molybdate ABC transporter substrate-binding protein [Hyphomicrobium sp.]MBZ0209564.1 molybdate ABC transporter substrate-binding protein [Hyphomicrobium sp.]
MSIALSALRAAQRLALVGAFTMLAVSTHAPARADEAPSIAAAADLRFALAEVAELFRNQTGHSVKLVFGSSGNFFTQLEHGAPFEVYLSADEAYVKQLAARGLTRDEGTLYAVGRIVIFAPTGSPLEVDGNLAGLAVALNEGRIERFAIANPEHAPYGRAAREALLALGLWHNIEQSLVLGENASQAAQFAASGSAQGGIVPLSLVLRPEVADRGTWALLPESLHAPLRQRMVLLKHAGAVADKFYYFVQEPAARAILQRYGFVLPATN